MATSEQYCSAVGGVVCEFCPLNLVQETAWADAVQPGTTPYALALELGATLETASVPLTERSDEAGLDFAAFDGRTDDEFEAVLTDAVERAEDLRESERIHVPLNEHELEVALHTLGETVLTIVVTSQEDHPVVRGLQGCINKILSGECEIDRNEQPSPFAGIASRELGGNMLSDIARFGSEEDVMIMFERVWAWGWDHDLAPTETYAGVTPFQARLFLMQVADALLSNPSAREED